MARGARDDDEDDERFGRTATLIEKSDRLAREYSREREVRQHTDRVRRIEAPKGSEAEARPPRPRVRAGAEPDEGSQSTQIAPAPKPPPRSPNLPKERAEPLPSAPPVAPRPRPPPPRSALDDLAVELEELLRELRFGWRGLSSADRVTSLCAVSVLAGVLMPWISDPAHSLRVGLLSGGVLHLGIAVVALALVRRSTALRGLRMTRRDELANHRRISLWLVLLGAASTGVGAYLLLLYGVSKTETWPVQLHFGLYWTLVSGTGLSYGGYARFSDVRR